MPRKYDKSSGRQSKQQAAARLELELEQNLGLQVALPAAWKPCSRVAAEKKLREKRRGPHRGRPSSRLGRRRRLRSVYNSAARRRGGGRAGTRRSLDGKDAPAPPRPSIGRCRARKRRLAVLALREGGAAARRRGKSESMPGGGGSMGSAADDSRLEDGGQFMRGESVIGSRFSIGKSRGSNSNDSGGTR